MSTGYNVLICGSSEITIDHILAIQNIKKFNEIAIYSKNKEKCYQFSKKFNLKVVNSLTKDELKLFNLAVITSSSSKHLEYVNIISDHIKIIFVEKPVVPNLEEFKILKEIKNKKNIFIKEVSLFNSQNVNKLFNLIELNIEKFRLTSDFQDFRGNVDIFKSPISNHLPHWIDFANLYFNNEFEVENTNFELFDEKLGFHKKISLTLKNKELTFLIKINMSSKNNKQNILNFKSSNIIINLISLPLNIFFRCFNSYSPANIKDKKRRLINFYKTAINEVNLNQDNYLIYMEKKIKLIDEIIRLSKK